MRKRGNRMTTVEQFRRWQEFLLHSDDAAVITEEINTAIRERGPFVVGGKGVRKMAKGKRGKGKKGC